jgi:hypothetical protein
LKGELAGFALPSGAIRFGFGLDRRGQMVGDAQKAKRYQERAAGLRKIAGDLPAGNTQRMILGIAMEYERLSALLDHQKAPSDPISAISALKKPDNSDQ